MDARQTTLTEQRATLLLYLRSKLEANDLHGVMDAAADMRELDARLEELAALPSAPSDVTHPPQCSATVMGEPCVMVAGHQGAHMNADLWRAEAH